jgi:nucleotide-binding universal stress UspA family protein
VVYAVMVETGYNRNEIGKIILAACFINDLGTVLTYKEALRRAREMATAKGVTIHSHVIIGHEVKTFVEFIRQRGYDLLVIGFMGHSALYGRVMGSTCQSLVRLAPCTVLVVK